MKHKGEDNHLATAMDRSPGVDYSHITPEACMVMKKASCDDFSLRQGAGKSSRTPRDGFNNGGRDGTFRGIWLRCLGFSRYVDYMGDEAESEAAKGAHTYPRCG